jgi:predicted enzyme related to lactoylglutathione lyase
MGDFGASDPDIARSKAFHGSAFGWSFVDYGPTRLAWTYGVETSQVKISIEL